MRPAARPRPKGRPPAAWAVLLLAAWMLMPAVVRAQEWEILIVRAVVNGKSFGMTDVRLVPGGDLMMSLDNLTKFGVTDLPVFLARKIGDVSYLKLSDLYPRVNAYLDRPSATLYLNIEEKPAEAPQPRPGVKTFEPAILTVTVNGAPVGERIVSLTPAGRVLMSLEDVRGLGVESIPPEALQFVEGRRHVALDDLAPWMTYDLNERGARLAITVDPKRLTPSVVDLTSTSPPGTRRIEGSGGFVNYAADYLTGDGGRFSVLSVPLEVGARIGNGFAFTGALFTRTDGGGPEVVDRFVRQDSHLTFDDEPRLIRYRIGDVGLTSDPLGGFARVGGISVTREFAISPHFIRYPGISMSGTLDTPSDVEVYSNGVLIRRDRLPAGEFTYEDLPRTTGAGESEVVIRDSFGRVSRLQTPFYVSPQLLKRGLSSFQYAFGLRRQGFGVQSFDYGGPVFSATHRMGVSNFLTAGLRAEADSDAVDGGPDLVAVLGRMGQVDGGAAWSRADGLAGTAWRAGYAYAGGIVGVRLSALGRSREYATISLGPDTDRVRRDLNGTLSLRVPRLGSFSVSQRMARNQPAPDLERTSLFFARSLGFATSLFVRASRSRLDTTEDEVFVGLTHYLGADTSLTADWQRVEDTDTARAVLQRNAPLGPGWGYRLDGSRTTPPDTDAMDSGDAFVEYHGPYGIYQAEGHSDASLDSYRASAAGAVAWTAGTVRATRPVHDAFLLVRVPGVPGVKVYDESRLSARTGADGTAILPDLISYVDNRITIDPTDVPMGYELNADTRIVTVPYRGMGELTFPAARTRAVVGHLVVRRDGAKVPVELVWMTLQEAAGEKKVPVGRGGEFYLENLAPGGHSATVTWKSRPCAATINVPETDDVLVDLGDVVCVPR